jgi:hypothetical protein
MTILPEPKKPFVLTAENYFSLSADRQYMSNSQFKEWTKDGACTASCYARYVEGSWSPETTLALAYGSIVDAMIFEDEITVEQVKIQYSEFITTKTGKPNVEAKKIEAVADYIKTHPRWSKVLEHCTAQEILTWQLDGVWFKCKIDILDLDHKNILDFKTTADLNKEEWVPRLKTRANFISKFNYIQQMAVYQDAVQHEYEELFGCGILAVQKPSKVGGAIDSKAFTLKQYQLDFHLERVKTLLPQVIEYKETGVGLRRCEKCDYCRDTRTQFFFEYEEPNLT